MCGRYSLIFIDDLGNRFRVFNPMIGARSRFNIAPGNVMPVIVNEDNNAIKNYLVMMKWGLVSPWTQKIRNANSSINARAETLKKKPSFANLLVVSFYPPKGIRDAFRARQFDPTDALADPRR